MEAHLLEPGGQGSYYRFGLRPVFKRILSEGNNVIQGLLGCEDFLNAFKLTDVDQRARTFGLDPHPDVERVVVHASA